MTTDVLIEAHRLEVGDELGEERVAAGDLGVVQRLEIRLVVVVDLQLAALDEPELHAGLGRFQRPE